MIMILMSPKVTIKPVPNQWRWGRWWYIITWGWCCQYLLELLWGWRELLLIWRGLPFLAILRQPLQSVCTIARTHYHNFLPQLIWHFPWEGPLCLAIITDNFSVLWSISTSTDVLVSHKFTIFGLILPGTEENGESLCWFAREKVKVEWASIKLSTNHPPPEMTPVKMILIFITGWQLQG